MKAKRWKRFGKRPVYMVTVNLIGPKKKIAAIVKALTQNPPAALSPREKQVAELRKRGHFEKEIAEQLHLNISSVKTYVFRAKRKSEGTDPGEPL